MKLDLKILMIYCFFISIMTIIVGFFLWTILIPIQDFHTMSHEEILWAQQELALNYPLGRFLLYAGFIGLISSSAYFIVKGIKTLVSKVKKKS